MKIYIAMIADRHTDVEAHVFTQPAAAIAFARATAIENAHEGEADLEEESIPSWLYYARYSPEGDSVWVVESELNGAETYEKAMNLAHDIASGKA